MRYLLWIRLIRVRKVTYFFFQKIEKDTWINYMLTKIVKLIAAELYCMHTVACVFYYLVTTLPQSEEGYTWIRNSKCWEDFLEKISHTEGGLLSIFENDVRISGVVRS